MTLRAPLAFTVAALLAVLLLSGLAAKPVSAHSIPEPAAYAEVEGPAPAQIDSPTLDERGDGWILVGAAIFIIFIVIAIALSILGYLEATRRD